MISSAGIDARFKLTYPGFTLDVELTLPATGVTALFGPSGSGKSTLLRCIAGLEKAQGSLSVKGQSWQDERTFLPPHQRPIAYVFQEATLFPHLSVLANLDYGYKRQSAQNPINLNDIIELLGIGHLLKRKPQRLSGGEKQRVAIARALAVNPQLLLMDEPLAALDQTRKREILPFLEKLHDALDLPVLYVTHASDEVARLADHVVMLDQGKVQRSGTLNDTFSHVAFAAQNSDQACVIIEAHIREIAADWHLALASFDGGELWLRDMNFSVGQNIRFQVQAKDVSLTLNADQQSSISNVIPAIVDNICAGDHPSIALARLKVGKIFLLCRLTQRSAAMLNIQVGMQVWAQIKSAAIIE